MMADTEEAASPDSSSGGEAAHSHCAQQSQPAQQQQPQPQAPLPPFISKLAELVNDPTTQNLVCWSEEYKKTAFVVWDPVEFAATVLPKHFKHSNFCSFVRQLNIYGFHKIESEAGFAFKHEYFRADAPHMLRKIVRRRAPAAQARAGAPGAPGCTPGAPSRRETAALAAAALSSHALALSPPPHPPVPLTSTSMPVSPVVPTPQQPQTAATAASPAAASSISVPPPVGSAASSPAPMVAVKPCLDSPPSSSMQILAASHSLVQTQSQTQVLQQPQQQQQQQQQQTLPQQQAQMQLQQQDGDCVALCKMLQDEILRLRQVSAETNATVVELRTALQQAHARESALESRLQRISEALQQQNQMPQLMQQMQYPQQMMPPSQAQVQAQAQQQSQQFQQQVVMPMPQGFPGVPVGMQMAMPATPSRGFTAMFPMRAMPSPMQQQQPLMMPLTRMFPAAMSLEQRDTPSGMSQAMQLDDSGSNSAMRSENLPALRL